MDRLTSLNTEWVRNITFPLQEICGTQSSIAKAKGGFCMVCAQGSNWRMVCKVAAAQERAFNTSIAGPDDSSRPDLSCLRTMEDRQILIDQLSACDMEDLVPLWDLGRFYDSTPFHLIRSQLNACGYPEDSTARILIQHGAPMLI